MGKGGRAAEGASPKEHVWDSPLTTFRFVGEAEAVQEDTADACDGFVFAAGVVAAGGPRAIAFVGVTFGGRRL